MKIAIVAPSRIPFAIGWADKHLLGLQRFLNREAGHEAELIKLPAGERTFAEIVDAYERFFRLALDHFDLAVSTGGPAWMIRHPRHVCYLQRRPPAPSGAGPSPAPADHDDLEIAALQRFMLSAPGVREALPEFFGRIRRIIGRGSEMPALTGPFAREAMCWLDTIGLAPGAVARFAAVSRLVADGIEAVPAGAPMAILPPPASLGGLQSGGSDHLLASACLDRSSRIDLIVEAMRRTRFDMPLVIVGTGPEEGRLRSLAAGDPRIRFFGAISDGAHAQLYADARAVLVVPEGADCDIAAIEAMAAGKPVVTTEDSGAPRELVEPGWTGLSVAPDPLALAAALTTLADSPELAARLGGAARDRAGAITWRGTVEGLLTAPFLRGPTLRRPRRKISVAVTFPVWPPRGGGQNRIFHLYRHLARSHDVDVVCVANANDLPADRELAPGLREIRVPKSPAHRAAELALSRIVPGVPITDVAMPRLVHLTPEYRAALEASAAGADLLVASHPYLFPVLRAVSGRPVWYEAHNVETTLKRDMLPDTPAARGLLAETEQVERACCAASERVIVCAGTDGLVFQRDFGVPADRILEIPNGVDLGAVTYTGPRARRATKDRLGLREAVTALFMGSGHKPNIDAVEAILRVAPECPDLRFLVMGSVCGLFAGRRIPPNVGMLGEVDDETKDTVLGTVDCALNPMAGGSGTNLKMLDYFAAGVPVISTPHGARGLAVADGVHLRLSGIDVLPAALRRLREEIGGADLSARVVAARLLVQDRYGWTAIADRLRDAVDAVGG